MLQVYSEVGGRFLSSADAGGNYARPMRLPDPSPALDKNRAPMGPEILSSTGARVWRKAPMAFPDCSSVLDKFRSAKKAFWGGSGCMFWSPCGSQTFVFLKLFWHDRDIPAKCWNIPGKNWFPWVSRDKPKFMAPTPSRGRPPPHRKISGPQNLGLGFFFLPDQN